jgi:hypothetical protein
VAAEHQSPKHSFNITLWAGVNMLELITTVRFSAISQWFLLLLASTWDRLQNKSLNRKDCPKGHQLSFQGAFPTWGLIQH